MKMECKKSLGDSGILNRYFACEIYLFAEGKIKSDFISFLFIRVPFTPLPYTPSFRHEYTLQYIHRLVALCYN